MAGPLAGIRVLDLSRVLAGPWATQCLGDMGADVIKVERPGSGDDTRAWGPPFFESSDPNSDRIAGYYLSANRNKRSIALDITSPEGQHAVRQIALESDILVENFKVGGLKKYGLDYESLAALNPKLIYCSITGFGQTGPYAARPGYDFLVQGLGGMMSVTGERDDMPGGGPQKTGVATADVFTGLYGVIGILAALHHREKTGEGQHIDMSLLDTQVAIMGNQAVGYLVSGKEPKRMGNAHTSIVPYEAFESADGHVILAVGNDSQFKSFCDVVGRPELAIDPRYQTNTARVENRTEIVPIVQEILRQRSTDDWVKLLEQNNVPCSPINGMKRVFEDPQVVDRGVRVLVKRSNGEEVPTVGNPIRFSKTPVEYHGAAPDLGEHTAEILREIKGLSDDERAKLLDALADKS